MACVRDRLVTAGRVLGLLVPLLAGPGCQTLSRARPVVVQVRDAETKQPISGAEVTLSYPLEHSAFGPSDSRVSAGGDGIARLCAVPSNCGVDVGVNAPGYTFEEQFVSGKEIQEMEPVHLFESVERRPVTIVLEMYNIEPRPTVELVLPAGYRGEVKVELEVAGDVPCTPGQRHFVFAVPNTGLVKAKVPPVFRHVVLPDISGRYPDGPLLTSAAKEAQVGFWWLHSEGNVHTYIVGLESEYLRARPAPGEGGRRPRPSDGGGKGHRGGRGGRGGGGQQ